MQYRSKGFTLIELAVVIAIIGILAAVGLNSMAGMNIAAERGVARDFTRKLQSGVSLYIVRMGRLPTNLADFVDGDGDTFLELDVAPTGATLRTVSVATMGNNQGAGCSMTGQQLTCGTSTFPNATEFTPATGVLWTYDPLTGSLVDNVI